MKCRAENHLRKKASREKAKQYQVFEARKKLGV
jgi:hypothetical protein